MTLLMFATLVIRPQLDLFLIVSFVLSNNRVGLKILVLFLLLLFFFTSISTLTFIQHSSHSSFYVQNCLSFQPFTFIFGLSFDFFDLQ